MALLQCCQSMFQLQMQVLLMWLWLCCRQQARPSPPQARMGWGHPFGCCPQQWWHCHPHLRLRLLLPVALLLHLPQPLLLLLLPADLPLPPALHLLPLLQRLP
jgi:hypothetical protein